MNGWAWLAGQSTPGLASLLGNLGVETSFEEASQWRNAFCYFGVSDNTVRKHTEGYGRAQAALEEEWKHTSGRRERDGITERNLEKRTGRIYASVDGAACAPA